MSSEQKDRCIEAIITEGQRQDRNRYGSGEGPVVAYYGDGIAHAGRLQGCRLMAQPSVAARAANHEADHSKLA